VAVTALPFVRFAYRAPGLHVVLETANALIALLVAYLVLGRFRQDRRTQELLLVLAMCSVAVANLVLTAVPYAVTIGNGEEFSRWAGLVIRLLGTLLLVAAALTPPARRVRRHGARLAVLTLGALTLAAGAVGIAFGDRLPPTVDPAVSLIDGTAPSLVAHPVVLAVQALGALLYAVAAIAFTRQTGRTGDELMRWVAAGCVLAATARIHYLLFPSLYSEYVYTGDLLRLGFYVLMLVGAAREIRSYWEDRARAAVLEDRRRMARDLHDGLTQELAYISSQTHKLTARPDDPATVQRIGAAAGRAMDEARLAIAALTRPVGTPFPEALQQVVDDMAHRHDVKIVTDLAPTAQLDPVQSEIVLRIVGEAVLNAARHGSATRIDVRLTASPLCLSVTDDGRGFVAPAPSDTGAGGFGITSMRERAAGLGGTLTITSEPGEGTTVQVSLP
jgi:signal transduction histidine kinase